MPSHKQIASLDEQACRVVSTLHAAIWRHLHSNQVEELVIIYHEARGKIVTIVFPKNLEFIAAQIIITVNEILSNA